MSEQRTVWVVGNNGLAGSIVRELRSETGEEQVLVRLISGRELVLPRHQLAAQSEGTYYVNLSPEDLDRQLGAVATREGEALVVPVLEETLDVQKRTVATGVVRVHKTVREREEVIDEPLLREQVDVERVGINQVVAQAPEVRREGDVLIIPVLEEVLVVEKRLLLKEEIRISLRKGEFHSPQTVTVRSEEITIERSEPAEQAADGTDHAL
ncbi:MAG: YsnF/AvaK domain-containing protein [Chloroflexales bacterium]|nr:YsnF/AvaK domain-containing protein [Chloroflexales bacterium]